MFLGRVLDFVSIDWGGAIEAAVKRFRRRERRESSDSGTHERIGKVFPAIEITIISLVLRHAAAFSDAGANFFGEIGPRTLVKASSVTIPPPLNWT